MRTDRCLRFMLIALLIVSTAPAARASIYFAEDPAALQRADRWFAGGLGSFWKEWVVDPSIRRQAVRKLRRFSNSLDNLANEKQELSEALAGGSTDRERAKRSLANFKDTVQQLRKDLQEFSSYLPESHQREGLDIARDLFDGLSQKWDTLNRAEQLINSGSGNTEPVINELKSGIKLVQSLKGKVDKLATSV